MPLGNYFVYLKVLLFYCVLLSIGFSNDCEWVNFEKTRNSYFFVIQIKAQSDSCGLTETLTERQ
jgi:hypothetical protein